MPWACQAGGTLLIPSGERYHLFVVLNSPIDYSTYPPQSCVLVSFSTIRLGPYDTTRIIPPGVHPFIQALSFVAYRQARMETVLSLVAGVNAGMYIPRDPIPEDLRKNLIEGLYVSPLTPRYLKMLEIV